MSSKLKVFVKVDEYGDRRTYLTSIFIVDGVIWSFKIYFLSVYSRYYYENKSYISLQPIVPNSTIYEFIDDLLIRLFTY